MRLSYKKNWEKSKILKNRDFDFLTGSERFFDDFEKMFFLFFYFYFFDFYTEFLEFTEKLFLAENATIRRGSKNDAERRG